jgi:hypothetical protein
MDTGAPAETVPAREPVSPTPEPLLRAGLLLSTGLMLGFFLGAAMFGQRAAAQPLAQRGFGAFAHPRALAAGEEAFALPPGHPPVDGFSGGFHRGFSGPSQQDDDSSGCPYLDSQDAEELGSYEADDDGTPGPAAPHPLPLRFRPAPPSGGPI